MSCHQKNTIKLGQDFIKTQNCTQQVSVVVNYVMFTNITENTHCISAIH